MKHVKLIGIVLLLITTGCSSLRITNSWKSGKLAPQKYTKIMVLGLIREVDRTLQMNMENHFVADLKSRGYDAISSLQEYGPRAFDNMDEQAAIARLKNSGVDAVITIVLLDKEKESKYVPARINYSPFGHYQNRFWGYRTVLYSRIYEPGYFVTSTKYFWESNLYEMQDQSLVYSVQTKSFDPADTESMAHEYGQLIVKTMVKENVLQSNTQ